MFASRAYFRSYFLNTVLLVRTSAKANARIFCIRIRIRVINNENSYSHKAVFPPQHPGLAGIDLKR